jgi:hypothetical protein
VLIARMLCVHSCALLASTWIAVPIDGVEKLLDQITATETTLLQIGFVLRTAAAVGVSSAKLTLLLGLATDALANSGAATAENVVADDMTVAVATFTRGYLEASNLVGAVPDFSPEQRRQLLKRLLASKYGRLPNRLLQLSSMLSGLADLGQLQQAVTVLPAVFDEIDVSGNGKAEAQPDGSSRTSGANIEKATLVVMANKRTVFKESFTYPENGGEVAVQGTQKLAVLFSVRLSNSGPTQPQPQQTMVRFTNLQTKQELFVLAELELEGNGASRNYHAETDLNDPDCGFRSVSGQYQVSIIVGGCDWSGGEKLASHAEWDVAVAAIMFGEPAGPEDDPKYLVESEEPLVAEPIVEGTRAGGGSRDSWMPTILSVVGSALLLGATNVQPTRSQHEIKILAAAIAVVLTLTL